MARYFILVSVKLPILIHSKFQTSSQKKSKPQYFSSKGYAPPSHSNFSSQSSKMRALSKARTSLSQTCCRGWIPLQFPAFSSNQGEDEPIRLLLFAKFDLNSIELNHSKRTALHIAAIHGQTAYVKLLLQYIADTSLKDSFNKKAEELAKFEGYRQCKKLIRKTKKQQKNFTNLK